MVEEKNEGGRPKIEFDLKQVEGLGAIQATYDDMAAVLGCSRETIINRMEDDEGFSTAYKKGAACGKVSLRRLQWNSARGEYNPGALLTDLKGLIKHAEKDKILVSELQTVITRWEKTHKSGNTTMQIWLGKQWLGQQDKTALEHSGSGVPIQTECPAITKEMSAKEAANIYARMIKEGNGND